MTRQKAFNVASEIDLSIQQQNVLFCIANNNGSDLLS